VLNAASSCRSLLTLDRAVMHSCSVLSTEVLENAQLQARALAVI